MRLPIYGLSFLVAIVSLALSIVALVDPSWIVSEAHLPGTKHKLVTTYGLFQKCETTASGTMTCRKFPTKNADCRIVGHGLVAPTASPDNELVASVFGAVPQGAVSTMSSTIETDASEDDDSWGFCESIETAGYAAQLSVFFAAASILSTVIVTLGGRQKRATGWRVVSATMGLMGAFQIVAFAFMTHERLANDQHRFSDPLLGWTSHWGKAWVCSVIAWSLNSLVVLAILLGRAIDGGRILLGDDGYSEIGSDYEEDEEEGGAGPDGAAPQQQSAAR